MYPCAKNNKITNYIPLSSFTFTDVPLPPLHKKLGKTNKLYTGFKIHTIISIKDIINKMAIITNTSTHIYALSLTLKKDLK